MASNFVSGLWKTRPTPPPVHKPTILQKLLQLIWLRKIKVFLGLILVVLSTLFDLMGGVSACRQQYAYLKPVFSPPEEVVDSLFDASFEIENQGALFTMYNLSFSCNFHSLIATNTSSLDNVRLTSGHETWLDQGEPYYYKCPLGEIGDSNSAKESPLSSSPQNWTSGSIQIEAKYVIGTRLFGQWFVWPMAATSENMFFLKTKAGYKWKMGTPIN